MTARMIVEMADGSKIHFGRMPQGGLGEVSIADDAAKVAEAAFAKGLGALAGLVKIVEAAVEGIAKKPDKVEVEFRASISGECNLWVVSGDAEAEFKVTLAWGK